MANVIVIKKGAGVPAPDQLQEAELALDVTDGALYSKLQDGSIHHLNDGADDVDLSDYVTEAPIDAKQYARQDGSWSEIVIPDGGTGSSVHIGDTPPDSPQEGQQWMEVPADGDATMWIFDGANWLQQPGGKDGADGADGANGTNGTNGADGNPGADGKGWTGGTYDPADGKVKFTSNDGLEFETDDLRSPDSGGGFSVMEPYAQPSTVGTFTAMTSARGCWEDKSSSVNTTKSFIVPDGLWFLLSDVSESRNAYFKVSDIRFDGVQMYSDDTNYLDSKPLFGDEFLAGRMPLLIKDRITFAIDSNRAEPSVYGFFVPADITFRDALKAMRNHSTQEIPE
jgi:hypothetical protein